MSFLFPNFLYALFAVSIPIIIHLFNFRKYKKVYFTNVKFLRELKQESQSKNRLKELLILLSRILAVSCLVLAFSQPVLIDSASKIKTGNKAVAVYLDNSFSMEGINKNGSLLSNAKKRAKEIASAFGNTDKFMLLTNDFEGKHQRFSSKEEFLDALEDVKITSAVKPLSLVVKRQADFLKSSNTSDLRQYILSDFQKSTTDINNIESDTLISSVLIPINANNTNNIYIDTCWFETPIQQKGVLQKLNIRIYNKSDKFIENATVKLTINKKQIGIASFNAQARSKTETKITFECKEDGFNYCSLKIDDYPIVFDDELFFTFNSRLNIPVLQIIGKGCTTASFFKTLMQSDSLFNYNETNEHAIDYGLFSGAGIIVLNEIDDFSSGLIAEINKYVINGGQLIIVPAAQMNSLTYTDFYKTLNLPIPGKLDTTSVTIEKTNFKSGFYEGVFEKVDERMDLPLVKKRYLSQNVSRSNITPILKLLNGETWLGEFTNSASKIYLFNSSLNLSFTNFCKHALFVPTIYKMAINSIKPLTPYYSTQNNSVVYLNAPDEKSEDPYYISETNKKYDIIPEMRRANNRLNFYMQNQITNPGFYNLVHKDKPILPLAFNYNRMESELDFFKLEELDKLIADYHLVSFRNLAAGEKSITTSILETSGNTKLWKLFIILTLIFVAIEIALIRFLK